MCVKKQCTKSLQELYQCKYCEFNKNRTEFTEYFNKQRKVIYKV